MENQTLPRRLLSHLRVRVGAEVAAEKGLGAVEVGAQLVCVGQVAIVYKVDAQGAVDEEGLRFLRCKGARSRVPDMANACCACRAVCDLSGDSMSWRH